MDGGMVEAALLLMLWELYVADVSESEPATLLTGDIVL
jgi:hypothetical protein